MKNRTTGAELYRWLGALLAIAVVMPVGAQPHQQVVDGVAIYLGIVPAQVVRGHDPKHAERQMHDGAPAGENHLVAALFDDKSGKRITDAEVTAKVSGKGSPAIEKRLEPMEVAGATSYGGYFYMAGAGPYRIELRIHLTGAQRPIRAIFNWSRR